MLTVLSSSDAADGFELGIDVSSPQETLGPRGTLRPGRIGERGVSEGFSITDSKGWLSALKPRVTSTCFLGFFLPLPRFSLTALFPGSPGFPLCPVPAARQALRLALRVRAAAVPAGVLVLTGRQGAAFSAHPCPFERRRPCPRGFGRTPGRVSFSRPFLQHAASRCLWVLGVLGGLPEVSVPTPALEVMFPCLGARSTFS